MSPRSKASSESAGIVILCDPAGVIRGVAHDGVGLGNHFPPGMPFDVAIGRCGAGGSGGADEIAARFLRALIENGCAFGWEIELPVNQRQTRFSFTGGAASEGILIVAEPAYTDAARLVEELMRINNETLNALRAAVKQAKSGVGLRLERDNELLNELSRANNETLTVQRELHRKNAALTQANQALERARQALEAKQSELEDANARLDAVVSLDGLTGIKNRRAFEAKLSHEIERAVRSGSPLSLILLDVDRFKDYNDTFGHVAGDEVLKLLGRRLELGARVTDFVARYGGEEFILVLPATDAEGATRVAERLRGNLEAASWPERPVTASLGVATSTGDTSDGVALISAADRALYASKANGRNRVTHALDLPEGSLFGASG